MPSRKLAKNINIFLRKQGNLRIWVSVQRGLCDISYSRWTYVDTSSRAPSFHLLPSICLNDRHLTHVLVAQIKQFGFLSGSIDSYLTRHSYRCSSRFRNLRSCLRLRCKRLPCT